MDDTNVTILSTILFWSYIVVGLLTEAYILWLFPYTGLGGLIGWPIAIVFSLAIVFAILTVYKKYQSKRLTVILFVVFITIQMYLQLFITPQEIGANRSSKFHRQVQRIGNLIRSTSVIFLN